MNYFNDSFKILTRRLVLQLSNNHFYISEDKFEKQMLWKVHALI